MPVFVAFLRAINVGGRNVGMAELRDLFAGMGFTGAESFIASGNIIFDPGTDQDAIELEAQIETHLAAALGYAVATFVRTPAQVGKIASRRPFGDAEGSLQYGLVTAPIGADAKRALAALQTDADRLAFAGREIAWLRPDPAASKLTGAHVERAIRASATFRNVTTLRRLAARYAA